jgi:(1->4)-alpha-D-glucan 1-alpha-D-glucosylmutase
VKRRLASLTNTSVEVRALVDGCVRHFNGVAGQPRSFDATSIVLNQQSYRLAHWRVASEEINYRRFFDVNQLAALRMEVRRSSRKCIALRSTLFIAERRPASA